MIDSAVHHVYVDGPEAAIDFLADAELVLREPGRELDAAPVIHLLDHLYNWLQFRAILPEGKQGVLDLVAQAEEALRDNDREYLEATLRELREVVDGNRTAPDVA